MIKRNMAAAFLASIFGLSALAVAAPPYTGNTSGTDSAAILNTLTDTYSRASRLGTYSVEGVGYTAYATPTDLICIFGSASKTVAVHSMVIAINTTSAALQAIYYIKRSTADTGGTSTNPTAIPSDSAAAAATAVVSVYTVAPTTGSAVGNYRIVQTASTVLASTPAAIALSYPSLTVPSANTFQTPLILHGVAEGICMNYNGAALTGGFTAGYAVEWTEY